MVTVKLLGGLGNQMFQLAFAMALEHRGYQARLDKSRLVEGTHREYSLGIFGELTFGPPEGQHVYEGAMPFNEEYLKPADGSVMVGYWQTEKYFKGIEHKIRRAFQLKSEPALRDENTAFVHVRRGDYVNLTGFHGMPSIDYYRAAIDKTGASKVLVFSDDPAWCLDNFPEHQVIVGTTKYEDLALMASCKHGVLSNSSFSWWGAWLGETPQSVYVAPKQWFTDPNVDARDIAPERWVRL